MIDQTGKGYENEATDWSEGKSLENEANVWSEGKSHGMGTYDNVS